MKKETIEKLCKKHNFESLVFVEWFMRRFPNEPDNVHSYCEEWIERFKTGQPEVFMDNKSLEIYFQVLSEKMQDLREANR